MKVTPRTQHTLSPPPPPSPEFRGRGTYLEIIIGCLILIFLARSHPTFLFYFQHLEQFKGIRLGVEDRRKRWFGENSMARSSSAPQGGGPGVAGLGCVGIRVEVT